MVKFVKCCTQNVGLFDMQNVTSKSAHQTAHNNADHNHEKESKNLYSSAECMQWLYTLNFLEKTFKHLNKIIDDDRIKKLMPVC